MFLHDLPLLLGQFSGLFAGHGTPGWARMMALLGVALGFAVVRVAAHRSPRSPFRLNRRDPFQWAELGFFLLLALLSATRC